jgi:hypothetical protein
MFDSFGEEHNATETKMGKAYEANLRPDKLSL